MLYRCVNQPCISILPSISAPIRHLFRPCLTIPSNAPPSIIYRSTHYIIAQFRLVSVLTQKSSSGPTPSHVSLSLLPVFIIFLDSNPPQHSSTRTVCASAGFSSLSAGCGRSLLNILINMLVLLDVLLCLISCFVKPGVLGVTGVTGVSSEGGEGNAEFVNPASWGEEGKTSRGEGLRVVGERERRGRSK